MIQHIEFHIHGMDIDETNGVFDVSLIIDTATGSENGNPTGLIELKSSSQTRVEAVSDVLNQLKEIVKQMVQRSDQRQLWTQQGEEP